MAGAVAAAAGIVAAAAVMEEEGEVVTVTAEAAIDCFAARVARRSS